MEIGEAWDQGSEDWEGREWALSNEVDNYQEMDNCDQEGENQSNNAIESQLTGIRYKLTQRGGKYSSQGSQRINEQETPGMRKEINREETNNCYGGATRRLEISDRAEHNTFIRALVVCS